MNRETQIRFLKACGRYIRKQVEPLTKQIETLQESEKALLDIAAEQEKKIAQLEKRA